MSTLTVKARTIAATARGYLWWLCRYQWWLLRHIPRGLGRVAGWGRKFAEWVAAGKTFTEDAVRLLLGLAGIGVVVAGAWIVLKAFLWNLLMLPYDIVEGLIFNTTGILLPAGVSFWITVYATALAVGWYGTRNGTPAAAKPEDNAEPARLYAVIAECMSDGFRRRLANNPDALTVGKFTGDHAGRTAPVTMPIGYEVKDLPRSKIASGWGVATDQLTITTGETDRHAVLRFADVSPSELPTPSWALAGADRFDLTTPVHIGHAGNDPVTVPLFSYDSDGDMQAHHVMLSGLTGQGKSALVRLLLTAAMLDPRAVINVAGKDGLNDFRKLAPGLSWLEEITDRDAVRAMLEDAETHRQAVERGQKPKVPYLIVLDEAQDVLGTKKALADARILALTETLLAKGRSAGVCVIVITPRPTSGALHPDIVRRPQNRIAFCLGEEGEASIAMNGASVSPLGLAKFMAAVRADDGFTGLVKTAHVTKAEAEAVAVRCRREPVAVVSDEPFPAYGDRPQTGTPQDPDEGTQAPGRPHLTVVSDPEPPPETARDHVRAVWPPEVMGVVRLQSAELQTLLAERYREYAGHNMTDAKDAKAFNAKLRDGGVPVKPGVRSMAGAPATTGVYWADVEGGGR